MDSAFDEKLKYEMGCSMTTSFHRGLILGIFVVLSIRPVVGADVRLVVVDAFSGEHLKRARVVLNSASSGEYLDRGDGDGHAFVFRDFSGCGEFKVRAPGYKSAVLRHCVGDERESVKRIALSLNEPIDPPDATYQIHVRVVAQSAPAPRVRVRLISVHGDTTMESTTGADGIAVFSVPMQGIYAFTAGAGELFGTTVLRVNRRMNHINLEIKRH